MENTDSLIQEIGDDPQHIAQIRALLAQQEITPIPDIRDIELSALRILKKQADDQVFELKKALRPFATLLQDHNNWDDKGKPHPDDKPIFGINGTTITLGDLRRAYAAVLS